MKKISKLIEEEYKLTESVNSNDPYGEEDWDEDYDVIFERPGFIAKHKKGGSVGEWTWNVNIPNYWLHVIEKNPEWANHADKKEFYCGFLAGFTLADEFYEKIKGQSRD